MRRSAWPVPSQSAQRSRKRRPQVAASGAGTAYEGAVHGARAFGVLGGVLRDVSGHLGVREFAVAERGYLVHLEAVAPPDDAFADCVRHDREPGTLDRQADGRAEGIEGGPGRGRGGVAFRTVESDDRMEVDQAALLVLGDLGEGDAEGRVERLLCHAEVFGKGAAEVGREACPQGPGVSVPQHGARVAVACRAERGTEFGSVLGVALAACAGPGLARIGRGAVVDRTEGRGGEGDERARVVTDGFGDVLATGQPGLDQVVGVGRVEAGAGGAAGGAAISAGGEEASGGFVLRVVGADHLPGGLVGGDRPAVQVDRTGAAPQVADLFRHTVEVVGVGQFDQVPQAGTDDVVQVEGAAHDGRGVLSGARVSGRAAAGFVRSGCCPQAWRGEPRGGRG